MPKQNRVPVEYNLFQRVDEDTSIEKIGNGTVATFDDMVMNNPYGSATIRGAYTLKNGSEPTNAIERMINVKDADNAEYLIAGNGALLSASTGGLWHNLKSGLTGTGHFQFTQVPKGIVFTNGFDKPFILSGTDFTVDETVEIIPPDVSAVTMQRSDAQGGELTASRCYMWVLVYKTEVGEISNVSQPFTMAQVHSVYEQNTSATARKFIFRDLPISTDSRVTSKVLYRTEGWDYFNKEKTLCYIYYKVASLDKDITLFVDDTADVDLDFGDVVRFVRLPNKAEFTTRSNNRLWFANYELPKIHQIRPPLTCLVHGAPSEYPVGSGQDWIDSATPVLGNLDVTNDIVSSPDTTGLIPSYYYQYMYTYVNHNGIESRPSYGTLVFQSGATGSFRTVTTALYDAGRIGSNNSDLHDRNIKSRRIYRTQGWVASFTAGTKPFFLVEEQLMDTGDIASYISTFFVDDNTHDGSTEYTEAVEPQISAVGWSKVDRPAYFAVEDVKQVFAEEQGDPITGFLDDGNGILIWKENSIVKLYHTGAPNNWYLRKVWNENGCDEPLSLIKVGNVYYFSFRKRIYSMTSGQAPIDISYGRFASFKTMTILNVVGNDQWVIYTTTDGTNQFQMVYDRVVKTWYKFTFGTVDLTCSMFKKYDSIWAGIKNIPLALISKKTYDYDDTVVNDEFSGGNPHIDPSMTFPLMKLKGTHSKIRNIVLDWINTGTGTLKLTLVTDAGTTVSNIVDPDDTGLTRLITTLTGLPSSNNFKLKISGIIQQINGIRLDLRPTRSGLGT